MLTAEPLGPVTDESPLPVRIAAHYYAGATSISKTSKVFGVTEREVHEALKVGSVAVRPQRHHFKAGPHVKQIVSRARRGESARQIGRSLNLGADTVLRIMRKHGIEPGPSRRPYVLTPERSGRAVALYSEGRSLAETAAVMGCGVDAVRSALSRAGVEPRLLNESSLGGTPEMRQLAVDLYMAGAPSTAVAAQTGLTYTVVLSAVRRAGHQVRKAGPRPVSADALRRAVDAYVQGATLVAASAGEGIPKDTLRRALGEQGIAVRHCGPPRTSPDDLRAAVDLYAAGSSAQAAAAAVGVSRNAVLLGVRARGIPVRSRGPVPRAAGATAPGAPMPCTT